GGAIDDDRVYLAVAAAAAGGGGEVEVDLSDVGAAQVADVDGVGSAQSAEVDLFDAVEVHGHVADVAEEAHPRAVGGDIDVLADVGPDEAHRVVAALALDHIAAVAWVPGKDVVAGAAEHDVIAPAPFDHVIAVAADQQVAAVAAGDLVVAR